MPYGYYGGGRIGMDNIAYAPAQPMSAARIAQRSQPGTWGGMDATQWGGLAATGAGLVSDWVSANSQARQLEGLAAAAQRGIGSAEGLNRGIVDVDRLIREVDASKPRQADLDMAGQLASQSGAARGMTGVLGASLPAQVQAQMIAAHNAQRLGRLSNLQGQRHDIASQLEELQNERRMAYAEYLANKRAAANAKKKSGWRIAGSVVGAIGGAIATPFTGGVINPVSGAAIGGAAGMGIGELAYK